MDDHHIVRAMLLPVAARLLAPPLLARAVLDRARSHADRLLPDRDGADEELSWDAVLAGWLIRVHPRRRCWTSPTRRPRCSGRTRSTPVCCD